MTHDTQLKHVTARGVHTCDSARSRHHTCDSARSRHHTCDSARSRHHTSQGNAPTVTDKDEVVQAGNNDEADSEDEAGNKNDEAVNKHEAVRGRSEGNNHVSRSEGFMREGEKERTIRREGENNRPAAASSHTLVGARARTA